MISWVKDFFATEGRGIKIKEKYFSLTVYAFKSMLFCTNSMMLGCFMTTVRKTITLTDTQSNWVKSRIARGDFTNDSEYFRDLIRRDQERSAGLEQLRAALLEGEESGFSHRTLEEIRRAARERLIEDGKLQA